MQFSFIADGIDAVVIDNFYTEHQLNEIYHQLNGMTNKDIMVTDKDKLEAAVDPDGNFITTKYGVWFNDDTLPLIKFPKEILSNRSLQNKFIEFNSMYRILFHLNRSAHLLSYYENAGYYSKHIDASVFTILSYFHQEPKNFTGGDIILHSHDLSKKAIVETKNNRVVIIPSCTLHEVTTVEMTSQQLDGSGRYCCSIFLSDEYLKNKEST